jgi:hypothetical protein
LTFLPGTQKKKRKNGFSKKEHNIVRAAVTAALPIISREAQNCRDKKTDFLFAFSGKFGKSL